MPNPFSESERWGYIFFIQIISLCQYFICKIIILHIINIYLFAILIIIIRLLS